MIADPHPNSLPPLPIPVYTLPDMVPSADPADFVVQCLETTSFGLQGHMPAHRHDHYEISWFTGGRGSIAVDAIEYAIKPSLLCYFAPGQVHTARVSEPLSGYSIRFTHAFFVHDAHDQTKLAELPLFYPPDAAPLIHMTRRQAATVDDLLQKIEQEYQSDLADRATVLRAYLHILLVEIKRLRQHITTTHSSEASYLLTKRFLLLVEAHYRSGLSIPDYATQLHVSAAHLNQIVRRTLNKTAQTVIHERVLLEAQRLLRYSELSMGEIAAQLNFRDPSYFGRFFKKQTGRSPQAFRQLP